jgi:hypothetical protein
VDCRRRSGAAGAVIFVEERWLEYVHYSILMVWSLQSVYLPFWPNLCTEKILELVSVLVDITTCQALLYPLYIAAQGVCVDGSGRVDALPTEFTLNTSFIFNIQRKVLHIRDYSHLPRLLDRLTIKRFTIDYQCKHVQGVMRSIERG